MKRGSLFFGAAALCTSLLMGAPPGNGLGIFDEHGDVGAVEHAGSASWDAEHDAWTLTGSGENMWFASDAFQFVWKKASGDITLTADIAFPKAGGNPHRKAVLMVRQSLDADAAYADVALHGNGLTSLQYRDEKGANTHEIEANVNGPARLRIEKRGAEFFLSAGGADAQPAFAGGSVGVPFHEPFYVGIGVCAHEKDAVETAVFSHLKLEEKAPAAAANPVLYATLETVTVASTDRRVTYVTQGTILEPKWSPDGASISFRRHRRTERIAVDGGTPVAADPAAAPAPDANSDGRYVYFNSDRGGNMQVWRRPAEGAGEEQLTAGDLANWFPRISPDRQRLAFISFREQTFAPAEGTIALLRVMNLSDGRIATIATLPGGSDAPSWSPDGRRLTFVSFQWKPAE